MSFFTDAHDIVVRDSAMTAIAGDQHIHYHSSSTGSAFDLLLQHSPTAALFDSITQRNPEKYVPREAHSAFIDKAMSWVKSDNDSASICWLKGPAGVGKSALEYRIAKLCEEDGLLIGGFAFSKSGVSDGNLLIPTLAFQLANAIPSTKPTIERNITQNPNIFERYREKQLDLLIIKPLKKISMRKRFLDFSGIKLHARVIAIDGLDECSDPDIQRDILKIIGDAVLNLELPIRFLISSRPEAHISETFDDLPSGLKKSISHLYLGGHPSSTEIHTYFEKKFHEIRRTHKDLPETWPRGAVISNLVESASGQFIYAKTATAYIISPGESPDDLLQEILALEASDKPLAPLDALYYYILSSAKPTPATFQILGCLILPDCCSEKLSNLTTPVNLERYLGLRSGDVRRLLVDLHPVLTINGDNTPVKKLHPSLASFLLNKSKSKEHFINIKKVRNTWARGGISYLRILKSEGFPFHAIKDHIFPIFSLNQHSDVSFQLNEVLQNLDFVTAFQTYIYSAPHQWESASQIMDSLFTFHQKINEYDAHILRASYEEMRSNFWNTYLCEFQPLYTTDIHVSSQDIFIILWGHWECLKYFLGMLSMTQLVVPEDAVSGQVRFTSPRGTEDPAIVIALIPTSALDDLNFYFNLEKAEKKEALDGWLTSKYGVEKPCWKVWREVRGRLMDSPDFNAWDDIWTNLNLSLQS